VARVAGVGGVGHEGVGDEGLGDDGVSDDDGVGDEGVGGCGSGGKLGAWSAVDQADPTIKLQGFWLSSSILIMYSKYLNHDLSRSNSIITAS
jgi:hypothetical protein